MLKRGLYLLFWTFSMWTIFLGNTLLFTALRFVPSELQIPAPCALIFQPITDYQNHVSLFTSGSIFQWNWYRNSGASQVRRSVVLRKQWSCYFTVKLTIEIIAYCIYEENERKKIKFKIVKNDFRSPCLLSWRIFACTFCLHGVILSYTSPTCPTPIINHVTPSPSPRKGHVSMYALGSQLPCLLSHTRTQWRLVADLIAWAH